MANTPGTPWSTPVAPVPAPAVAPVAAAAPTPAAPAAAPAATSSTIPFDVTAYLKQHPELAQNYASGTTPDGRTYQQVYGSLANYAATNALRTGGPDLTAAIKANNFVLPSGTTATINSNGEVNFTGGNGLSDNTLLTAAGYESQGGNSTPSTPLEQQLLTTALPELQNQITGDANRRSIADNLANQTVAGAAAANAQLQRTQGGHFDGATYFQKYPDVASAYQSAGGQAGTGQTVDQYAEQHYLNNGQKEGRSPFYVQSAQLSQDFNNANQTTAANIAAANQATQTQLQSLSQATTQMQQNLTGDLATKAAALQQQLTSLQQNATTLDAAQKAALTQQITSQIADLHDSIATQRQALQDQITALGTAADTQSQAKLAALNQEIQGLTAAQAPLNAARLAAAGMQATAINTGLESTKDQLTAQNALAGYYGGSTGQDAALARATIAARQNAAQAVGGAQTQNATDTRDIGFQGATGQNTIASALADAQNQIAQQSATGKAALTSGEAVGTQQLKDTQAGGTAAISGQTAQSLANIGNLGATTTYGNVSTGADQSRTIADALAQGSYGLNAGNAAQTLAANQAGNAAKATYYDNNYNRSLAAALAPASIASGTAGALTGLDQYATSGLNGALNTLNWWSTNSGTPPTPGAIATQPSTAGNSLSNLGSGLVNAGIGIGNSQNWWQSVPTKTTATSISDADITAALGSCWIGREVYGVMNPRWMQFRGWMLAQAPAWFRKFYLENGERIAIQISDKQSLKDELRSVMDMILQTA